ncbi:MAG: recombinase family protein [Porphyromonas somerae]|uniref:recombinase family protein n=1 Tax=Porphyromonas somerae TaxID=322095 RepID=UPI0026ECCD15|nr:recombinase family protein [Porphyromonas somerae]MDD7557423.1 recombinase family protein [Porphyromonas somerae]MDY5815284.1 recombinase family protein [Porphyromonas somerae]
MAKIGYARVSTREQNLDLQIDALNRAGCDIIFSEKISSSKERKELERALEYLREGDILVVWKLDRLARSLKELVLMISSLSEKGIEFKSLSDAIDTTSSLGKCQLGIFASLAQYERDIIKERTRAGLEAARRRGKVGGRPKGLSEEAKRKRRLAVKLYEDPTIAIDDICKATELSKATLYRYLKSADISLRR